jgi:GT2 family glycosyltransferase
MILVLLTLIIPCFNHRKVTAQCLASIFKSDLKDISYKAVVIDDASTDYTGKLIQTIIDEGHPVELITNKVNMGYVDSTNKVLRNLNSEYVLFMNNDVLLEPTCIRNLLGEMLKRPEYGIIGGTQYDHMWRELSPLKYFVRGEEATLWNHILVKNLPIRDIPDIINVDDTHFACSICSKKVVDKIGFISEEFRPGNYDQEDYCLRVKEAGFKIGIATTAKYIHNYSTSTSDNPKFWEDVLNRNRETFWAKWGEKLRQNLI